MVKSGDRIGPVSLRFDAGVGNVARNLVFAGVTLHVDGSVRFGDEWQDTSSCHAEVHTAGQVRDRATLTRVAGGALVAGPVGAIIGGLLRKRVDEREVLLLITGGKHDWLVPVPTRQRAAAAAFAAAINTAARQHAEVEAAARAPQAAREVRTRGVYQPGLRSN